MNLSFWPRLPRKTKLPYQYCDRAPVTVKSRDVTAYAIFHVIRQWHVAGCIKLLESPHA